MRGLAGIGDGYGDVGRGHAARDAYLNVGVESEGAGYADAGEFRVQVVGDVGRRADPEDGDGPGSEHRCRGIFNGAGVDEGKHPFYRVGRSGHDGLGYDLYRLAGIQFECGRRFFRIGVGRGIEVLGQQYLQFPVSRESGALSEPDDRGRIGIGLPRQLGDGAEHGGFWIVDEVFGNLPF